MSRLESMRLPVSHPITLSMAAAGIVRRDGSISRGDSLRGRSYLAYRALGKCGVDARRPASRVTTAGLPTATQRLLRLRPYRLLPVLGQPSQRRAGDVSTGEAQPLGCGYPDTGWLPTTEEAARLDGLHEKLAQVRCPDPAEGPVELLLRVLVGFRVQHRGHRRPQAREPLAADRPEIGRAHV